jgi:hypothetical protein
VDYNRNVTESLAHLGGLDPVSQAAATVLTSAIDMALHRRVVFELQIGALTGSVDFKIQASATSGGSYADVTGFAITQVTVANKKVRVECKAETVIGATNGNRFIKGSLTVTTGPALISLDIYGTVDRYEPASDQNVAAVTQTLVP